MDESKDLVLLRIITKLNRLGYHNGIDLVPISAH